MTDVVAKLWEFCNYLRHEGITYGNYIEQLTYLLFLKMAQEKEIKLPKDCSWDELIVYSGSELLEKYSNLLEKLAKQHGLLEAIFTRSRSEFTEAINLKKLLNLIDEIKWTTLPVDVKGAAYEGLLEKFASEEKGAGEYFTPRVVIDVMVRCVKPDFRNSQDYSIHDPACGTGGFLIRAFEWTKKQTKGGTQLTTKDRTRLLKDTFSGMDNVILTRRLALMNCYLHSIEPKIRFGDSLGEGEHVKQRYNVILTNPPFGTKGAGQAPDRDDFIVPTPNKQMNFIQHTMTILKVGGNAAMIVPDNVLFDNSGKLVRENLMKKCNLHTILRLPEGTFSPYTGVKANVIFFVKGKATKDVWVYDLRTNIKIINKGNPITKEIFEDFEKVYSKKNREESERFKKLSMEEIAKRNFSLDIFWLKDESLKEIEDVASPKILAKEMSVDLKSALDSINKVESTLGG